MTLAYEGLLQLPQPSPRTCLHSAQRVVKRCGDLLVRATAKVVQLNHLALLKGQLLKGQPKES